MNADTVDSDIEASWNPRDDVQQAIAAAQEGTLNEDSDRLEAAGLQLLAVARRTRQEGWR